MARKRRGGRRSGSSQSKHTGEESARVHDRKSARQRFSIDRETVLHIGGALIIGVMAMAVIVWLTPPPQGGRVFFGFLILGVAGFALLFETADSASGMGFGTALTPILFLLDYEPRQVVPVILVSEGVTGLVAGWFHHQYRNVDLSIRPLNRAGKILLILLATGLAGVIGSVIVTYRFQVLEERGIKIYVAITVLIMAVAGLAQGRERSTKEFHHRRLIAFAALAGINKGVGGGGYGPVVTLGEIFSGVYEKTAAALTNLSEGFVALAGAIAFFALALTGGEVYFALLPSVFLGGYLGALVAPYLLKAIPNRIWRYVIPTYGIVIATFMLFELFGSQP